MQRDHLRLQSERPLVPTRNDPRGPRRSSRPLPFLFLLALVGLPLGGCGDGAPGTDLPGSPGEAGDRDDAVGTWALDPDATLAANREQLAGQLELVPAPNREAARRQLEAMFLGLEGTLELSADGSLVSRTTFDGRVQEMRGTWERRGASITTRATEAGSSEQAVLTGALDGDRLEFADGDEPALVFRRR